nr:hypothetical protein [Tanacetum cinerariifolium]
MAQDGLNFIHELNTQNDSWMIKVRIVRLWKQPFSLDMILMDERGEKIQGTIKGNLIHTFERLLAEGSVVVLSKSGVAENSCNYRIINHPCAQELSTFVNASKSDGCVILIIQFARIRLWKGVHYAKFLVS